MGRPRHTLLRLSSFDGGLNEADPSHQIADNQLQRATNLVLTSNGAPRVRPGAVWKMGPPSTSLVFDRLIRHTPSNSLADLEVWAIPRNSTTFYRSTSGTTWASVTGAAQSANSPYCITDSVSFAGKLYIAYKKSASTDRLHCWDGTAMRAAGISTPSAPTAADTGSGSYAAAVRYYKVQFYYQSADSRVTYSDLSAALTFTPSGSGTGVVVTKPTTPDSATGWRVWASADNVSYYLVQAGQAVATTTYADTTVPSAYASSASVSVAPEAGSYTPPWSAKYLLVDENRLLIAGAFETTRYASRIGWSEIQGTAASAFAETGVINDDERFLPGSFLDLDTDEGGEITGMASLNGVVYVFKREAIYKLVRTGNADAPYRPVTITKSVGALYRNTISVGEDEAGSPCLYFLSERGPYRYGTAGLQHLGGDLRGSWLSLGASATPHAVFDIAESRWHLWLQGVNLDAPDHQYVFHAKHGRPSAGSVKGGWTRHSGTYAVSHSASLPTSLTLRASEMAPHGILLRDGSTQVATVLAFRPATTATAAQYDSVLNASTGAESSTANVTGGFQTKDFSFSLGVYGGVADTYLTTRTSTDSADLLVELYKDFAAFGSEAKAATFTLTGSTRTTTRCPNLSMASAQFFSVYVAGPGSVTFEDLSLRLHEEESR